MANEQNMTFEQGMQKLEEIVSQLEAGDAPLDKCMALFEEGTRLSARLSDMLDKAEQKVTLMTTRDGEQIEIPFEAEEVENHDAE